MVGAIALSLGVVGLSAIPAHGGLHFEESHHEHNEAKDGHEEDIEIQVIPANAEAGIYMLLGQGGNIGVLVGEDGVFMIDDQFAPLTEAIQTAIAELGNKEIRFVLNTHWHFDHTGGNENLGNQGVLIVAHDNVRERMSTEQVLASIGMEFPASPEAALPALTFSDRATFYLNDQTVNAIHVEPAHTDGDTIIQFAEANVLHLGDTYFNGFYPFIDFESGGSLDGMIAATEQGLALANDETVIIPGHGPISNRAELESYHQLLLEVREVTQSAIDAGLSLDTFIQSQPLADYDEYWGSGFLSPEQFMTIVYNGLNP
ncbi:MAG: MBL fold metallo-hydrolase [Spirulina sp. SIO3F2]|nr:MBL fold metallo-hydrolase [Spirulina sp. SIO3F2]